MTKKSQISLIASLTVLLEKQKVSAAASKAIIELVDTATSTRKSGYVSVKKPVSKTMVKEDGTQYVTHLLDSASRFWLEATADNFYEDKSGKSTFINKDGVALKRLSKEGESITKKFYRAKKEARAALVAELISTDPANIEQTKRIQADIVSLDDVSSRPDFSAMEHKACFVEGKSPTPTGKAAAIKAAATAKTAAVAAKTTAAVK